jgi:chemotaxis signal transduction protein
MLDCQQSSVSQPEERMKHNPNVDEQPYDRAGPKPEARALQLLQAGALRFGIFADEIAAIAGWRQPTPLPHAPKAVLGVVAIKGRMLTVLDPAMLPAGMSMSGDTTRRHLVALRGDEQLALAVTTVAQAIELDVSEIAAMQAPDEIFLLGLLAHEGERIPVINPKELFSTAIQGQERRRRSF